MITIVVCFLPPPNVALMSMNLFDLFFRARGEKKMNALQCARYVYKMEGIRGFYRGLTASYAGISETMICFLIYETLKKHLDKSQFASPNNEKEKGPSDFLSLMMAAAFSKGCASCIAYPHGKHLHSLFVCCDATALMTERSIYLND